MKQKKVYIILWIIIITTTLFALIIFTENQESVCVFWEEKIFNNCNCKYECRPKDYIGWVCDRLCPQEVQNYEAN